MMPLFAAITVFLAIPFLFSPTPATADDFGARFGNETPMALQEKEEIPALIEGLEESLQNIEPAAGEEEQSPSEEQQGAQGEQGAPNAPSAPIEASIDGGAHTGKALLPENISAPPHDSSSD